MTDFTIESGVRIPDREKRDAKRDLQQSIGDVTIDVEAAQSGTGGGASTTSLAGGAGVLDALDEQTDVLREMHNELEKIGVSGGGNSSSGGLLDGSSGVAVGSVLSGGTGGLLGTVLGKGKDGLRSLLKGRGSIKGAIGRSPFTMLSQTAGRRDIASRAGKDASGPVTGTMSDLATGEFQLQEDFWPDLSPPEDLFPEITPPDPMQVFPDLSPPDDLFPSLSPPEDLWGVDLSPPDDLWGFDLSPPEDLWNVDLSPPETLWGVDLSPPTDLWNVDLSPPDNFWPDIKLPSQGLWSVLNPSSGTGETVKQGTQKPEGSFSVSPSPQRPTPVNNTASTRSGSSQEPRVDVVIQEVAARIDRGRALEDAVQGALENVTPDIKEEVLAQVQADMPSRL